MTIDISIITLGHVDCGKSTLAGQLLGSDRCALDTDESEQERGITINTAHAVFTVMASGTERRILLLDAPGHRTLVRNVLAWMSLADIAILVVSARAGEFEAGFDRDGQTREHLLLAKTFGIRRIIVAINKMDDISVDWSVNRYNHIRQKITGYAQTLQCANLHFIPVSGLSGLNIHGKLDTTHPLYTDKSLLEYMADIRFKTAISPMNIIVTDVTKSNEGVQILGSIYGQWNPELPAHVATHRPVTITNIASNDNSRYCTALLGKYTDVSIGDIISQSSVPMASHFDILVTILECGIISAGYECILHCHAIMTDIVIDKIIARVDMTMGVPKIIKKHPIFITNNQTAILRVHTKSTTLLAIDTYTASHRLGRVALRLHDSTIGFGVIIRLN